MSSQGIVIKNLTKSYIVKDKRIKVIENLNLNIKPGKITCIVGSSGAGKTTLLKMLSGLIDCDEGQIILGNPETVEKNEVGFIFQSNNNLPWKTVEENITLGIKVGQKNIIRDDVKEIIDKVGLRGYENYYPYQISGGMNQRTSIARALIRKSKILLLDEPFSSLDYFSRLKIQELLLQLNQKEKITIVMVTHDIDEAINISNDICLLYGQPLNSVKTYENIEMLRTNLNNIKIFKSEIFSILNFNENK